MAAQERPAPKTVTGVDATQSTGGRASRLELVLLIPAGAGLLSFGWAGFGLNTYLSQVDPSQNGRGVTYSSQSINGIWVWVVVWLSLTLLASAGLPQRSIGGRPWWSARGTHRGAVFQGLGGALVAGGTAVGEAVGNVFRFSGPDDRCVYPSCWPLYPQTAALLAPGLLAGLTMIVMAFLVRRLPWWARAVVPVVVWVVGLVVQHLVWGSQLLPIFEGPPR